MPKQQTDHLVQLIRSLSKSEKRHFRLFVKRNQSSEDILFLQLFDVIDRHREYDEELILRKVPDVKKRQLSNLKAHLYKQLLISLRLLHKSYHIDIEIRERIDYARVLYNKGLYRASLEMLDKTKAKALLTCQHALVLEIVEFEKMIEGQYITRSIGDRADKLTSEAQKLTLLVGKTHAYSNLSLQLYGLYLKIGYVRNEQDFHFVREFFYSRLPDFRYEELDFYGKVYLNQSYVWYHYISQDFLQCYRYGQRWVNLFEEEPEMIKAEAPLYLKGLHNLLNALFNLWYYDRYIEVLAHLERFPQMFPVQQIKNIEGLYNLYRYIHLIKRHFLEGAFSDGLELVPELMDTISSERYNWDFNRVLVFYYNIACLYFGSGDFERAIDYLNMIINFKTPDFREDIQCFARILNLIAHFELGNAQLVEYQVKSVYRFLLKMKDMHQVQREIFKFLRRMPRNRGAELRRAFLDLKTTLEQVREDPYERRPFLYLDIISWLESKLEDKPVQDIIHRKFLLRRKGPMGALH
ncbi:MAG: hypothetical protein KDC30_01665 [Saprospiraceae bacterium]|nr:hypothetical protein [Saprospiraceae bacterium]